MTHQLEIKQIGRSHCIVAGKAVLGKFRTAAAAATSLANDAELYAYWAGSAGVSIQHAEPVVVQL